MTTIRLHAAPLAKLQNPLPIQGSIANKTARQDAQPMPARASLTEIDTLYLSTGAAAALMTLVLLLA